jgi:putative endonuclease
MTQARIAAYRRGTRAETVAALWLRLKGYRIVARRYRTPVGEIDIVARKGRRLAFVEVKRRKGRAESLEAIPSRQRRRIVRAAQYWLAGHDGHGASDLSFDVVLLAPFSLPLHIRDAFSV